MIRSLRISRMVVGMFSLVWLVVRLNAINISWVVFNVQNYFLYFFVLRYGECLVVFGCDVMCCDTL
jgi:hypothetical protein